MAKAKVESAKRVRVGWTITLQNGKRGVVTWIADNEQSYTVKVIETPEPNGGGE